MGAGVKGKPGKVDDSDYGSGMEREIIEMAAPVAGRWEGVYGKL